MSDNTFLYRLTRLANFQINPQTNCWEWTGTAPRPDGYCRVSLFNHPIPVHKAMWELYWDQPFPDDLVSRHLCNNRRCMNPEHIKPGTQKENMQDKWAAGTMNIGDRNGRHTCPECTPRGAKAGTAKLSQERVFALLDDLESGISGYEAADKYQLSKGSIRDIRHERTYIQEVAAWKAQKGITGELSLYLKDRYIPNKPTGRPLGKRDTKKRKPRTRENF